MGSLNQTQVPAQPHGTNTTIFNAFTQYFNTCNGIILETARIIVERLDGRKILA